MKKILIMCLIAVLAVAMSACGEKEQAAEEETAPEVVKIEKNIDAVAEALGLEGKAETYFEMIGAKDGAEFNGGDVEIYQYDPESEDYKKIEAGNGAIKAAACNSGFILVFPEGGKTDKKIVKAFEELSF